ncbi:MAG: ABC transporter ATP-binding protein [Chloroflexi bacterium]|nr:MAG: ABC transporter ATP-binding protein [Chloroflexota bacterium]MBL1197293.1 ABC transporter ATP-binding protein [Chloroflexota bacterium]NOH14589.1 ABC transporter ATP-binding protein [Chloroflexota bacterium]
MHNDGNPVIDSRGLSKTYSKVTALDQLDLIVPRNSIFGFLGPNGAGKTTTIKLLLGLAKPSGGGARIFGLDITQESINIRKHIGYLPQNPRFYPYMTARQTLNFVARFFYSGTSREIKQRVQETLDLMGLADKADRPIKGFSGGELQRLGIAQAQVNQPALLILDEPAASLDPLGRRDVLDAMERLRHHSTIFYSTHILDDVQRISDAVAILNRGKLVTQAPIQKLLADSGSLEFDIVLRGATSVAYERVIDQQWVQNIAVSTQGEQTFWQVKVTDTEAAEEKLLPLILVDRSVVVQSFMPQQPDLEETFLSIIGEGSND